jgi:hypothetical protein
MSEFKRYSYTGPQYHMGQKIAIKSNLYTMAKSFKQARNNFLFNIAGGDYTNHYDIVDDFIKEVPEKEVINEPIIKRERCENCGYELNDMGECPVCDYGEYDLLDLED